MTRSPSAAGETPALPPGDFQTLEQTAQLLAGTGYLADGPTAMAAFLAAKLQRPLLVEGQAGVGKTELAKAMAQAQGRTLIRLQCYEGIDESRALYEWEYGRQLLYTQLLKDRIDDVLEGAGVKRGDGLQAAVNALSQADTAFFSEKFLLPRPLLQAIRSPTPCLLLIDEIDKADPEFEAFLLELLADFAVTLPELGTLTAIHRPQVVLTSNAMRELSDALRRRCLHLTIPFPDAARELLIVRARVPGVDDALAQALVGAVQKIRTFELKKPPSVSELLDWVRALRALGRGVLDEQTLRVTLGVLLKHSDDHDVVAAQAGAVVKAALNPGPSAPG